MDKIGQFLFIVAIPCVIVVGAVVTLFAVGGLFEALDNLTDLRRRVEAAFRQPPKAPRALASNHYYRAHWN
jgi:HAMP domain-containing protein